MANQTYLQRTRDGYDKTASAYGERFHHHLDDKPIDQAVLRAFAESVSASSNSLVADVGCGTGCTTALLRRFGADAFGIDLSSNMIEEARRRNPGIQFAVGSMTALELDDQSVGGICAWYSIVHVPDEHLLQVFREFHRVLAPGGLLLLAFQVGDHPFVLTEAFGQRVELRFERRQPHAVATLLEDAGLQGYAEARREADGDAVESTPQAYLIVKKNAPKPV